MVRIAERMGRAKRDVPLPKVVMVSVHIFFKFLPSDITIRKRLVYSQCYYHQIIGNLFLPRLLVLEMETPGGI